jgi:hypothetical protein
VAGLLTRSRLVSHLCLQLTSGNTNAPAIVVGEKGADLVKADAKSKPRM